MPDQPTPQQAAQIIRLHELLDARLAQAAAEGIPIDMVFGWFLTWFKTATLRQAGPMAFIDFLAGAIQLDCQLLGADALQYQRLVDFPTDEEPEN